MNTIADPTHAKPAASAAASGPAAIELQGLSKSFGDVHILKDLNLRFAEGEFIVLVGPSGCGKSTLLRCIAGLESISAGKLWLQGKDCTHAAPVERGIAMVFQSYALYPHMTVAENIGFGLRIQGEKPHAIAARVQKVAQLLQLSHLLNRKPRALSGGQRQRVAIGRALARQPKMFLFDEPLSNLDAALRGDMRVELAKLHQSLGNTMIYVTHDQVEAMTLATQIVVMNAGRIEQVGTPLELFNRPATRFVAAFLGQPSMNFISADPAAAHAGPWLEQARQRAAQPDRVHEVGVRPDDLRVATAGEAATWQLAVEVVEHLGSETLVHGRLPGGQALTVRAPGQLAVQAGDALALAVNWQRALFFDSEGRHVNHHA